MLETQLNDFDPTVRATALEALVDAARRGEVALAPEADVANMHCHTFFSFNAYGYSPSGLAWLAWGAGVPVVMISGFTLPHNEFYTPYRVINFHVCNGCWTDSSEEFVHADFAWCPRHENTEREFECTRFISPGQVCQHIDRLMADYGLDPKEGRLRERMTPQPATEAAEDALHVHTAPTTLAPTMKKRGNKTGKKNHARGGKAHE